MKKSVYRIMYDRMRGRLMLLLAAVVWISGCAASELPDEALTRADSTTGNDVVQNETAASPSQVPRIVATTVAIVEILDQLEMEVVGVPTSVKTLPERYNGVEQVGNPMSPDMERIRMLRADEVLSVTTLAYDLSPKFEAAGITASYLDLTSFAAMNETIRQLGSRYDRNEQAERLASGHERLLAGLQADLAKQSAPAPKVLILMGIPGSYLVATEHSYIGDLVKQLGGINVVQGEDVEYVASNTEHLHQAEPDLILRAAHGLPDEVVKMFDKAFAENDIWKHFKAVKEGRVYDLEETRFGTTGNLAVDEALEELMEMMYP